MSSNKLCIECTLSVHSSWNICPKCKGPLKNINKLIVDEKSRDKGLQPADSKFIFNFFKDLSLFFKVSQRIAFKRIFPNKELLNEALPPDHPVRKLNYLAEEADHLLNTLNTPEGRETWKFPTSGSQIKDRCLELDNFPANSPSRGFDIMRAGTDNKLFYGSDNKLSYGSDNKLSCGSDNKVGLKRHGIKKNRNLKESSSGVYSFLMVSFIAFFLALILYLIFAEMDDRRQNEIVVLFQEIKNCEKDYHQNFCPEETRVPILEDFCREKELCMIKDPFAIATRGRVLAKMLSDVVNTFFLGVEIRSFLMILALIAV